MTKDEIIRMFDHPATITEALEAAAALPFQGGNRFLFEQKRQKYYAGMSDYERLQWIQEMKAFLQSVDTTMGQTGNSVVSDTPKAAGSVTDIFVSYSHEDEGRVRPLVELLIRQGWSVFWDRTIPIGKTWHTFIEQALLESRCVLVAWSTHSVRSEWVIEEAEYAKQQGILVPILLDEVSPPFGFRRIQAANLTIRNPDGSYPLIQPCLTAIQGLLRNVGHGGGILSPSIVSPVVPSQPVVIPANFVLIRGGEFLMGSPEDEPERYGDDETQHRVRVSDFYMCKYAVSQAEWEAAMGTNPSRFKGANLPVEQVSWEDCQLFIEALNRKSDKTFRLPTEAEWEYACRAGTTTPFSTGDNLTTDQANYDGNYPYNGNAKGAYREKTVAVDSFAPNGWGLYNMHGNVWEWCSDWYGEKYYEECKVKGLVENPVGPETGSNRVLRGGSWHSNARRCRSARRDWSTPDYRNSNVGFRLVYVP